MNFIKKKFQKVVMTVDIDRYNDVKKSVLSIGFKDNVDFYAIGKKASGRECIEGLIPDSVWTTVLSTNPELSRRAVMGTGKEQKSAKSELKKKLLDEFVNIPITEESHKEFYSLIKKINKAFAK